MVESENQLIEKCKQFVREKLSNTKEGGHDYYHCERVWKTSKYIASKMKDSQIDQSILELGALLHDIEDWKFTEDKTEKLGSQIAAKWLETQQVNQTIIKGVEHVIENISFKGAATINTIKSIEGQIIQDADRLDAIGAIGIARCFSYGGFKQFKIYEPTETAVYHDSFESYKNTKASSITHFYEKLLLLKDKMNTAVGKELAIERHKFMEIFLSQFQKEWNCDSLEN